MRRRWLQLIALSCSALSAWAVAPALSLDRYVPPARDFEQPLPPAVRVADAGGAPGAGGGVSYRSPMVAAPGRFDLVGIAGSMRPYEVRAREEGGEWSAWTATANGDPVYTGGSDEVQVRARDWRPAGTLHYVNVSGTAGAAESLLTGARRTINGAVIGAAGLLGGPAAAAPSKPDVIGRGEWGANREEGGCEPRAGPAYGVVKASVIHHTVTANEYSEAEASGIVLGICRYHRNANGWNDIGYNALVDRFGNIYAGRAGGLAKAVVGAHAQGFNSQTTGVAAIGTHTTDPVPREALAGFASLLAWKHGVHGIGARGRTRLVSAGGDVNRWSAGEQVRVRRIGGHRRLNYTECPGDGLHGQLARLRERTAALRETG